MFKQVEKSDRIQKLVAAAYGDPSVRLDDLAIFEAVAINTLPLKRKGGLFEAAVLSDDTLFEMQRWLEAGNHVPLQLMHRDGIPRGKVFAGETRRRADGSLGLNVLFYLPIGTGENETIKKINAGVIQEVSIGVENKEIRCSSCGFDYLGASANIDNVFARTCDKGHTIGTNGVHARLHGLAKWMELSLVDRGAAQGANILPRTQQTFQVDEKAGFDRTALRLFASAYEPNTPETTTNMEELVKVKVDLALALQAKDDALAKLTASATEITTAKAETVSVKAALAAAEAQVAELKASDGEKAKADLATAISLIDEFASSIMLAQGKAVTLPVTLADKLTLIREGRTQLALMIPAGGASNPATSGGTAAPTTTAAFAGFKTRTK
jgi:hypothetical protein